MSRKTYFKNINILVLYKICKLIKNIFNKTSNLLKFIYFKIILLIYLIQLTLILKSTYFPSNFVI